jgi:integrase
MGKPFTDKLISNLQPKEMKYYYRGDKGFALRVMPSGAKTFLLIYTHNKKRRELNLGSYPHVKLAEASQKYRDSYSLVAKGIDPQEQNKAIAEVNDIEADCSFGTFAALYLTWSEQQHVPALYKTNKLSLINDVLPFWKDTLITDIGRRDVITLLTRVAQRAPGQASNVHRAARGVFNHALELEYIKANPCLNLNKIVPELKYKPRKRRLDDQEIRAVWSSLKDSSRESVTRRALKLILVTAQRPGEVAGMHSSEIQVGAGKPICATCRRCGLWTIPAERMKGREVHTVYLTATALELIGTTEGYIFPSTTPLKPIKRAALAEFVNRVYYINLPRWTPHDLRRTVRTCMEDLGIPEAHSEAVIAHCKKGIVKTYNLHEYKEEKRAALLKWEARLLKLVR